MTDDASLSLIIPTTFTYLDTLMREILHSDTLRHYGAGQMDVYDGSRLLNLADTVQAVGAALYAVYRELRRYRPAYVNRFANSDGKNSVYAEVLRRMRGWRSSNMDAWRSFLRLSKETFGDEPLDEVDMAYGGSPCQSPAARECCGRLHSLAGVMEKLACLCLATMKDVKRHAADRVFCHNSFIAMKKEVLRNAPSLAGTRIDPLATERMSCHTEEEFAQLMYHKCSPDDVSLHLRCRKATDDLIEGLTEHDKKVFPVGNPKDVLLLTRLLEEFDKYADKGYKAGSPNSVWVGMLYRKVTRLNAGRNVDLKTFVDVFDAYRKRQGLSTITSEAVRLQLPKSSRKEMDELFEERTKPYTDSCSSDAQFRLIYEQCEAAPTARA